MIRDRDELRVYRAEKIRPRTSELPYLPLQLASFDALCATESSRWSAISSADALHAEAARVRLELSPTEYARFIDYACLTFGIGLVRAAGLAIPALHLAD